MAAHDHIAAHEAHGGIAPIATRTRRRPLRAGACCLALAAATFAGCSSAGASRTAMQKVTPPFLLSEKGKAERNLKDPKSLNMAYGRFQEKIGQEQAARNSYALVLRDDPKSVDAVLGLARLDQLAGKPKEAEAGFQKALKIKSDDPSVLAACGQFYASQARWPEAYQSMNAAIALAPKETLYRHQLAVLKTQAGDVNEGVALFTNLVGPQKAHYNAAYLLRQEGHVDAAAEQCRMALAIDPNFEPAYVMMTELQSTPSADPMRGQGPGPVATAGAQQAAGVAYPESAAPNPSSTGRWFAPARQAGWQGPGPLTSGAQRGAAIGNSNVPGY